jgi:hypothetical protein
VRFAPVVSSSRFASVETLESRQFLSTYYVAANGSDSASGLSAGQAWDSINRVNAQKLKAGDKVLFEGGKTFQGSLYIPSTEGGTAKKQVIFSSYGKGRATISSGSKHGIDIAQTGGIAITNLRFVGSGMYKNNAFGIFVHVDQKKTVSSFHIKNVEVSAYGREGIRFVASNPKAAINDVKVEYVDTHDNLEGGLKANHDRISGMKNYLIDHVRAWNNYGNKKDDGVTGNGIFLEGISGGTINRCVAWNNGKDGDAPVGIWAAMGDRYTIQYCESYNNRTATETDGGGFDFDWDVKNSVMQYNYSHGNDGPGYVLAAGTHYSDGNVVRYNVSENDGRKNGKPGISIWGNVSNSTIHNNTVYFSPSGDDLSAALLAHDGGTGGKVPKNVLIRNNIFYTTGGVRVVRLTDGVAKKGSLGFKGNNYFTATGKFRISWGGKTFSDTTSWRKATGQEKHKGKPTGYQGPPRLLNPGKGITLGNADKLGSLQSFYGLSKKSKLVNKGMAIPSFLNATVNQDFFGKKTHGKHDIGASELV